MALRPVKEVERRFWRLYERYSPTAQLEARTTATLALVQDIVARLDRIEAAINVDDALRRVTEAKLALAQLQADLDARKIRPGG